MPFTIVTQQYIKQPATAVGQIIPLPSGCDYMKVTNLTQMAAAGTVCVGGEWFGGGLTANNSGLRWRKAGSHAILIDTFATSTATNGFTYVQSLPAPEAALTGTTITQANGAVASVTNTYSEGDTVIIYNAVDMEQISGMTFTISSVTGSQFTLLGLDSTAFVDPASSFFVRRVSQFTPVEPSFLYVTAISQATQGVVTVSQANSVYLGQKLEFTIPASCGMVQLTNFNLPQNLPVVVTAIVDAYNFKINVNTTNFTAFALPPSANSPTAALFPTCAPAGQSTQFNFTTGVQTGYNFTNIPFHTGIFVPYMYLGISASGTGLAGSANDELVVDAYKMETGTINAPVPS